MGRERKEKPTNHSLRTNKKEFHLSTLTCLRKQVQNNLIARWSRLLLDGAWLWSCFRMKFEEIFKIFFLWFSTSSVEGSYTIIMIASFTLHWKSFKGTNSHLINGFSLQSDFRHVTRFNSHAHEQLSVNQKDNKKQHNWMTSKINSWWFHLRKETKKKAFH